LRLPEVFVSCGICFAGPCEHVFATRANYRTPRFTDRSFFESRSVLEMILIWNRDRGTRNYDSHAYQQEILVLVITEETMRDWNRLGVRRFGSLLGTGH
jgi:hypothetical protein